MSKLSTNPSLPSRALSLAAVGLLLTLPPAASGRSAREHREHGRAAGAGCAKRGTVASRRGHATCTSHRLRRPAKSGGARRKSPPAPPRLTVTSLTGAGAAPGAATSPPASSGGVPPAVSPPPEPSPATPAPATEAPNEFQSTIGASSLTGETLDPIDPKFLSGAPFGTSSFWIQPWRSYLDTWPASRLLESLGINFNIRSSEAEATARLLQESGFKLARIGIGWGAVSYEDPSKFVNETGLRAKLTALKKHGLRPLILLNAD